MYPFAIRSEWNYFSSPRKIYFSHTPFTWWELNVSQIVDWNRFSDAENAVFTISIEYLSCHLVISTVTCTVKITTMINALEIKAYTYMYIPRWVSNQLVAPGSARYRRQDIQIQNHRNQIQLNRGVQKYMYIMDLLFLGVKWIWYMYFQSLI
jgi:hypothetical protein